MNKYSHKYMYNFTCVLFFCTEYTISFEATDNNRKIIKELNSLNRLVCCYVYDFLTNN
jgi:hypothetical protein